MEVFITLAAFDIRYKYYEKIKIHSYVQQQLLDLGFGRNSSSHFFCFFLFYPPADGAK